MIFSPHTCLAGQAGFAFLSLHSSSYAAQKSLYMEQKSLFQPAGWQVSLQFKKSK